MKTQLTVNLDNPWEIKGEKAITPVVLIVEGVHAGSAGPIFWPDHVLRNNADKWEGAPVCINHPQDEQGNFIPVSNMPNEIIGHVENVRYCSIKKGITGYISVDKNDPRFPDIESAKEVSIGVYPTATEVLGRYNGENYSSCAIGMEPDHLAILPDQVGACSVQDGCGIRANMNINQEDYIMEEFLMPAVHSKKEQRQKDEAELINLHKWADEEGVLLPSPSYGEGDKQESGQKDDDNFLLPPNL